jgi:hypothetical protein
MKKTPQLKIIKKLKLNRQTIRALDGQLASVHGGVEEDGTIFTMGPYQCTTNRVLCTTGK